MVGRQTFDQFAYLAYLVGVKTVGRFVKDQQVRFPQQGVRQAYALAVAFGKGADHLAAHGIQAALLYNLGDGRPDLPGRDAFKPGAEFQVFRDALVVVKGHVFRQVAQMFASLQGIFHNVEPGNRGCAGSGGQIAGQHAQSRGLACAVRPQEPYDFPLFNLEGGILYRLKAAKLFGKLVGVDHGINGNRVILIQTAFASSLFSPAPRKRFFRLKSQGHSTGPCFSSRAGGKENQSLNSSSSLWTISLTRTSSSIREATSLFAWMTVP